MHELPITLEIIRVAEDAAKKEAAEKVKKIAIVVGDLSGYVGESIRMYFDDICKGTMCEGAKLQITRVKSKAKCADCGKIFERKLLSFECPSCGGEALPTKIGSEFYIDFIEVQKEEDAPLAYKG